MPSDTKIKVGEKCVWCDGNGYPCKSCEETGWQESWITLEEFKKLLEEAKPTPFIGY